MRTDGVTPPVTETLAVEKAHLEQLQRIASIGAVAGSVTHEFNNILTTILNHAKLGQQANDLEAKDRALDRILSSARRAARIATGVLALSRNRAARRERVDLANLTDDVLTVLEKDLSKHQVRLERHYKDHPEAEVVAPQIEQVLMNLVINARQAMPGGGVLKVAVSYNEAAGMAEIAVRDTGVGIEADQLSRIFDPFFTTKTAPDESGQGGSGLGLAICRAVVERHQGRIRVESAPGKGTTFTVKLPAICPATPAAVAA